MEGGVIPVLTVSILVQSDVTFIVGSGLVVLQPIDVLVFLVTVGMRAVNEYGGGAGAVQLWGRKGICFTSREGGCSTSGVGSHAFGRLGVLRAGRGLHVGSRFGLPFGGGGTGLGVLHAAAGLTPSSAFTVGRGSSGLTAAAAFVV